MDGTVSFGNTGGTRQIAKTFIKGLLTIQDQELCKTHNKRKLRQQYRKSRLSGDKKAPLAVSFHHACEQALCLGKRPVHRLMFARISEVGPNRKLVPSTPRLS